MTNNFEELRYLLKNKEPGTCVLCVILPKNRVRDEIIASYFPDSDDLLLQRKKEIKFMCRQYNGTAFFLLNEIKLSDLQVSIGSAIAHNICYGAVQTPHQISNRVVNESLHTGPVIELFTP